jgi:hypothetical protein
MYLCILDQGGSVVLHKEVPAEPAAFLDAIAPFRDGLVVACECLFCWYWLADLCHAEKIAFVLGHALYMKAIHGGKAGDDKIDSSKIAHLLRGGNLPMAYAYPKGLRETRDVVERFGVETVLALTSVQSSCADHETPPCVKPELVQYGLRSGGQVAQYGHRRFPPSREISTCPFPPELTPLCCCEVPAKAWHPGHGTRQDIARYHSHAAAGGRSRSGGL